MHSNSGEMQKSCNEFQGFVLFCSLPLKQLSFSAIPFSFSETALTLVAEKLAASFCRINDFVSFIRQLCGWLANLSEETQQQWRFSRLTFCLWEWFRWAHMNFSSTDPLDMWLYHKHIYYWELSDSTLWPLTTGKNKTLSHEKHLCAEAGGTNHRFHCVCF